LEREAEGLKINEVEAQVGITKKNIRFYESEGLLTPRRNSENGYRDYGEEDVETLRRIKLMRKLGVPLEEIRQMQSGAQTVGDGMRRHLISLERERKNLEAAAALCDRLTGCQERLDALDAGAWLSEMEGMEQTGTTFRNKQRSDTRRRRYIAPAVVSTLMTVLLLGAVALLAWAWTANPRNAPGAPLLVLLALIPIGVLAGVYVALFQRVKEIQKGEIDDAEKY